MKINNLMFPLLSKNSKAVQSKRTQDELFAIQVGIHSIQAKYVQRQMGVEINREEKNEIKPVAGNNLLQDKGHIMNEVLLWAEKAFICIKADCVFMKGM